MKTTEYSSRLLSGRIFSVICLAVVLLATLLIFTQSASAKGTWLDGYKDFPRPAGDCFADGIQGDDFYPRKSCRPLDDSGGRLAKDNSDDSTVEAAATPKPVLPTEIVPTKVESTPTPEPTAEPTKECKNKNQYKEGTEDCNAGSGND